MVFTKATLWLGKPVTIQEVWCEILGQEWTDSLQKVIWEYTNTIILAAQGHQASYEEIENHITNEKAWNNSILLIGECGQELKIVAHDQVKSGYVSAKYFIGYEFNRSVSPKELTNRDFPDSYRLFVLQDGCLCCVR